MRRLYPLALDAAILLVFAAIGRRTHDEGNAIGGTLLVAAPFLAAWLGAALLVRLPREQTSPSRALRAWTVALPAALALRSLAFGRGLSPGFVVVALAFTLATLVGWRALCTLLSASPGYNSAHDACRDPVRRPHPGRTLRRRVRRRPP